MKPRSDRRSGRPPLLVPAALWLGRSNVERLLLIGAVLLVMIVELLNTAVEVVVDRIGVERHHLSGFAKDLGSSAVLLSLVAGSPDLGIRPGGWPRHAVIP